jgi:hypothetical protein
MYLAVIELRRAGMIPASTGKRRGWNDDYGDYGDYGVDHGHDDPDYTPRGVDY